MKDKLNKFLSRQFAGFLLISIVAAIGTEINWPYVVVYLTYVLGNQVSKHFPAILDILKAKFTKE
jgi:hypothetical protein